MFIFTNESVTKCHLFKKLSFKCDFTKLPVISTDLSLKEAFENHTLNRDAPLRSTVNSACCYFVCVPHATCCIWNTTEQCTIVRAFWMSCSACWRSGVIRTSGNSSRASCLSAVRKPEVYRFAAVSGKLFGLVFCGWKMARTYLRREVHCRRKFLLRSHDTWT